MKKKDPFSTPARRRRIIAELSRTILKKYCKEACHNVYLSRVQNKSALIIQCKIRSYFSIKKLNYYRYLLRCNSAILIQKYWRRFSAIKLKNRLIYELKQKRMKKLARLIEYMWFMRKDRMYRIAKRIQRKLAREKLLNRSAIVIQKIFRGYIARLLYNRMKKEKIYQAFLKIKSVVLIQNRMRMFLSKKRLRRLKTEFLARKIIKRNVIKWFKSRILLKNISATKLQKCFRGYSRRKNYKIIKAAILDGPVVTKRSKLLNISMSVDIDLLQLLAHKGPLYTLRWCLIQNIIQYNANGSFLAGKVLHQVFDSVRQLYDPNPETYDASNSENVKSEEFISKFDRISNLENQSEVSEGEKQISIQKWEKNSQTTFPDFSKFVNNDWVASKAEDLTHSSRFDLNVNCCFYFNVDENVSIFLKEKEILLETVVNKSQTISYTPKQLLGAVIKVENINELTDKLHISFTSDRNIDFAKDDFLINSVQRNGMSVDQFLDELSMESDEILYDSTNMKFKLKNALVYLSTPFDGPIQDEIAVENQCITEEMSEMRECNEVEAELPIIEPKIENPQRPKTAQRMVRIVLQEEPSTPYPRPVTIINYPHVLSKIQVRYKRKFEKKIQKVKLIQRIYRKLNILIKWRENVYKTLNRAHHSAIIIQALIRGFITKRKFVIMLREKKSREFQYGHNFLLSESENWKAFGNRISQPHEPNNFSRIIKLDIDLNRLAPSPIDVIRILELPDVPDQCLDLKRDFILVDIGMNIQNILIQHEDNMASDSLADAQTTASIEDKGFDHQLDVTEKEVHVLDEQNRSDFQIDGENIVDDSIYDKNEHSIKSSTQCTKFENIWLKIISSEDFRVSEMVAATHMHDTHQSDMIKSFPDSFRQFLGAEPNLKEIFLDSYLNETLGDIVAPGEFETEDENFNSKPILSELIRMNTEFEQSVLESLNKMKPESPAYINQHNR